MATFFRMHTKSIGTGATTPSQLWGSGNESSFANARMWAPFAGAVDQGTLKVTTTPAPATNYAYQGIVNGATIGTAVTVVNPNLSARGSLGFFFPIFNPASLDPSSASSTTVPTLGSPAVTLATFGFSYSVAAPNAGVCWMGAGDSGTNTLSGADRFLAFEWFAAGGSVAAEASAQLPWPSAGTFSLCVIGHQVTGGAGSTVKVVLRKNTADTALALTFASTGVFALASDISTTVQVAAGDLLDWRFTRTAGADTSLSVIIVVGFQQAT